MFWTICVLLACVRPVSTGVYYETNVVEIEELPYVEVISLLREPVRKGSWEITPTVFVCRKTPITRGRVYQAMRMWQRLGYELEGPFMNSEIPECTGESEFSWGNIVIELRGQDFPEDKLAVTRTYRRVEDDTIVGAVIQIQNFASEKERTIEHELGHALGWQHFNRKNHMMNAIHQLGGWDTYGLRRPRK
jgi:hypothetical protein